MADSNRYPANVFWSDEDEGFIAEAPDLPGCSAFGETQAGALAELQDAIAAWTEAAKSAGNPIPEPSRPAVERHSGKVLLRMPRSLHTELTVAAKRDDVSLNQYIVYLITKWHSERVATAQFIRASSLGTRLVAHLLSSQLVSINKTCKLTTWSEHIPTYSFTGDIRSSSRDPAYPVISTDWS